MVSECSRLLDDIEFIDGTFTDMDVPRTYNVWTHLFENLLFNMGDIVSNLEYSKEMLSKKNYTEYGVGIGHIVSDIFFLNAIDNAAWTSDNSRVINDFGSDKKSEKVPSSFYDPMDLQVEAVNPNSGGIFQTLGKHFKSAAKERTHGMKKKQLDKFMFRKTLLSDDQDSSQGVFERFK